MGTTNHGTQEITYEYFENATAEDFNKRHLNIQSRGIYQGGYLTRVSDSEITLSTFTAEIGADDEQISVKTSVVATITTALLDSGNLNSGTPYIALRWAFVAQQNNYIEIHAIASIAAAQTNDIIVGKVVFAGAVITGFDYTDRTFLNVQDLFFKVETSSGMYVQLRAGKIQDGSQCIVVPEQTVGPFNVPGAPNSRIDLVYVDTDGTVTIKQGSQAVSPSAPDYESKLVLSEVKIVNGDASIPADRITDVRSFLTSLSVFDPVLMAGNNDSNGTITLPNGFIMKWGKITRTGNNTTVTFGTAFPNACFQAYAGAGEVLPSVHSSGYIISTHTISKNSFKIYCKVGDYDPFRWWAIGR